jgi:hypothetical protein
VKRNPPSKTAPWPKTDIQPNVGPFGDVVRDKNAGGYAMIPLGAQMRLGAIFATAINAGEAGVPDILAALKSLREDVLTYGVELKRRWAAHEIAKIEARAKRGALSPTAAKRLRTFTRQLEEETFGDGWINSVDKCVEWLRSGRWRREFITPGENAISSAGNRKLPYFAFSTLPGVTCPGAGACLYRNFATEGEPEGGMTGRNFKQGWCYSFAAWRQPGAFFRQLANTILIRGAKHVLREELDELQRIAVERSERYTVRLYVDGDIDSLETLEFWMEEAKRHDRLDFYGYSKSWDIFLAADRKHGSAWWPSNYVLNLSGGSRHEGTAGYEDIVARMRRLPITRGKFVAVPLLEKFRRKDTKAAFVQNTPNAATFTDAQRKMSPSELLASLDENQWKPNPLYELAVMESSLAPGPVLDRVRTFTDTVLGRPLTAELTNMAEVVLGEVRVLSQSFKGDKVQNAPYPSTRNLFVCPGKCGDCLNARRQMEAGRKTTHACGLSGLIKPEDIVIGIH